MKLLSAILVASGSAAVVPGGAGTPCPSDCWNFDEDALTCAIDETKGCFALECEFDQINLSFQSKLFGVADSDAAPFGAEAYQPTFDSGEVLWKMDCALGACGMAVANVDVSGVNNLEFSFTVGKAMETFTLSGNSVFVSPVASAMKFNCQYPASMDVTSDAFTTQGATASGESTNSGSLLAGFGLDLYMDAVQSEVAGADNVFIGNTIYADMSWSVTSAQQAVKFYIDNCDLIDTGNEIAFINDNCYSSSLQVKQLQEDKVVGDSSKFSFVAFTVGTATRMSMSSTIKCSVKLCIASDTACTTAVSVLDSDCNNIADTPYAYKAITYEP